jgi:hypothetical protein
MVQWGLLCLKKKNGRHGKQNSTQKPKLDTRVNVLTRKYVSVYHVMWEMYQRFYLEVVLLVHDILWSKLVDGLINSPLDLSAVIILILFP